jgi:TPR repeat protein
VGKLFESSSHQGDPGAQFLIGEMRFKDAGLDNDYQKAGIWFKKSAVPGYPDAQFRFGKWYAKCKDEVRNLKLAYVWLKLAEKNGIHPQSR